MDIETRKSNSLKKDFDADWLNHSFKQFIFDDEIFHTLMGLIQMSIFFSFKFLPLLFTLFHLTHSAESSLDLTDIIKPKIQHLANLFNDSNKNEFEAEVKEFAFSFSNFDEPAVYKTIHSQLIERPIGFFLSFIDIISPLFDNTRIDPMKQICDALCLRYYCYVMRNFSIKNLTDGFIQAAKRIHNLISEIKTASKVGTSHVGMVLADFLNKCPVEEIILFPVLNGEPKAIDECLKVLNDKFTPNCNFNLLRNYISSASKFYEGCMGVKEEIILEKLSACMRRINLEFLDHVFIPIMTLEHGIETFGKLITAVEINGMLFTFRLIRAFPIQYEIAYFMILSNPNITTMSVEKVQIFLDGLMLLINRPDLWLTSFDFDQLNIVVTYIETHFVPHFPNDTPIMDLLQDSIGILRSGNRETLIKALNRTG